jgi:choline dehydrogenase-like flavoprotein
MDKRFGVIIIGSGAGGGTLARCLAPSGKSILILERGDWLKREAHNWDRDFWKNLALAAGFLLIVFGTDASSVAQFFAHPTIQSHPYRLIQEHGRP